jgi:hypothetical protein
VLRLTAAEARKLGLIVNKKTGRAKKKSTRPESIVRLEPGKLTIVIYDVPPSLNVWDKWHYMKKAEVKKQWEELIGALLSGKKRIKRAFDKPIVRITFYYNIDRDRDKDNMAPKWIMDGLVKAGVLKDDNSKEVDLDWCVDPGIWEWCRTEIVVWEG